MEITWKEWKIEVIRKKERKKKRMNWVHKKEKNWSGNKNIGMITRDIEALERKKRKKERKTLEIEVLGRKKRDKLTNKLY